MPVYRCPLCGTAHRVSVAQAGYLRIPCRRCARPFRLDDETADRTVASGTHPALAIDPAAPEAVEEATATAASTAAAPAVTAAAAGQRCPRCGGAIRDGAIKCRHCKRFLPAAVRARQRRTLLALLFLVLAAALLLWLVRPPSAASAAAPALADIWP